MVGGARVTFLLPDDVSRADIKFLSSVWTRLGGDPDRDVNWVSRWEDVVAAPSHTRTVVSFGKSGVNAWHRWGVVRVSDHGTTFHRPDNADGYWIMVCEHPAGVMQQTAWGHGVKENIMAELKFVIECVWSLKAESAVMSKRMGERCLQCLHGRDPRRVNVQHYLWEADAIAMCEDHWRRRVNVKIKKVAKKRVHPSSREAQLVGQIELVDAG